jgi:hypothetical protein
MRPLSKRPFLSDLSPFPHLRLIPGRVTARDGHEGPGQHGDRSRAERGGAGPCRGNGSPVLDRRLSRLGRVDRHLRPRSLGAPGADRQEPGAPGCRHAVRADLELPAAPCAAPAGAALAIACRSGAPGAPDGRLVPARLRPAGARLAQGEGGGDLRELRGPSLRRLRDGHRGYGRTGHRGPQPEDAEAVDPAATVGRPTSRHRRHHPGPRDAALLAAVPVPAGALALRRVPADGVLDKPGAGRSAGA